MRKMMVIASLVFSIGACGSKGGIDGVLSKMEDYKNQVCKCSDMACAEKVKVDMEKWLESQEKEFKDKNIKPTKEQDEKFDKIEDEMSACVDKLEKK